MLAGYGIPSLSCMHDAFRCLLQGQQLFSSDGRVFLVVQTDGNIVVYNALAYGLYGAHSTAAIWTSQTGGSANGPFSLAMQQVVLACLGFVCMCSALLLCHNVTIS